MANTSATWLRIAPTTDQLSSPRWSKKSHTKKPIFQQNMLTNVLTNSIKLKNFQQTEWITYEYICKVELH